MIQVEPLRYTVRNCIHLLHVQIDHSKSGFSSIVSILSSISICATATRRKPRVSRISKADLSRLWQITTIPCKTGEAAGLIANLMGSQVASCKCFKFSRFGSAPSVPVGWASTASPRLYGTIPASIGRGIHRERGGEGFRSRPDRFRGARGRSLLG